MITDDEYLSLGTSILPDSTRLLNLDKMPSIEDGLQEIPDITPKDLVGLFYSSGTTGKPKGVPRDHATILHRAWIDSKDLVIRSSDKFIQLRQFAFSASLADAMNALLNGCTLVIYDLRTQGLESLGKTLLDKHISIFRPPIELFRHFLANLTPGFYFPEIRCLVMTGAVLYRKDLELARRFFRPDTMVIHHLSSSETGVLCRSIFQLKKNLGGEIIPVGYPVEGKEILLLDETHKPVREGQIGEIAVRTSYRFGSYWHQPELTAQKIIEDPENPGQEIYLSGDHGRIRADGQLEFLGRKDNRVKIRGYSVDLTATETVLMSLEGIQSVVATAVPNENGEIYLTAYYTTQTNRALPVKNLRQQLGQSLPDYMLPTRFIHLSQFPLTESGKVNRKGLPSPEDKTTSYPGSDLPSNNDKTVVDLYRIWMKILQVNQINQDDDFFSMGGTSLTALRLSDEISRVFRIPFTPEEVFHLPTILQQAAYINTDQRLAVHQCLVPISTGGGRPAIFCVSPTIIDIYTYKHLAQYLDSDQPFYALYASHGLALDGSIISIREEIDQFIREIWKVYPNGPYILAGYSGGGKVAVEMAYHVRQAGGSVASIILMDAFAPGYPRLLTWIHPRLYSILRVLRRIGSYIWKFRILDRRGKLDLLLSKNHPLGPRFDNWVRNRYREMNKPVKASMKSSQSDDMRNDYCHLDQYQGKVTLLRAQKGLLGVQPDSSLGWSKYIKNNLEIIGIPGDHEAILFGPRAEKVARIIQHSIDQHR